MKPAIREVARRSGRDPEYVELATSVFVITGAGAEKIEDQREKVRTQVAFYASTPTYRVVLEPHGWQEVGRRLSGLARPRRWNEMPSLVTDWMLVAFTIETEPGGVGPALDERYSGLVAARPCTCRLYPASGKDSGSMSWSPRADPEGLRLLPTVEGSEKRQEKKVCTYRRLERGARPKGRRGQTRGTGRRPDAGL